MMLGPLHSAPWWAPPPSHPDPDGYVAAMREVERVLPDPEGERPGIDFSGLSRILAGIRPTRALVDAGRIRASVTVEHRDNSAYLALVTATERGLPHGPHVVVS